MTWANNGALMLMELWEAAMALLVAAISGLEKLSKRTLDLKEKEISPSKIDYGRRDVGRKMEYGRGNKFIASHCWLCGLCALISSRGYCAALWHVGGHAGPCIAGSLLPCWQQVLEVAASWNRVCAMCMLRWGGLEVRVSQGMCARGMNCVGLHLRSRPIRLCPHICFLFFYM